MKGREHEGVTKWWIAHSVLLLQTTAYNSGKSECRAVRARGVRNRLSGIPEVTSRSALNLTLLRDLTFVDDRGGEAHTRGNETPLLGLSSIEGVMCGHIQTFEHVEQIDKSSNHTGSSPDLKITSGEEEEKEEEEV